MKHTLIMSIYNRAHLVGRAMREMAVRTLYWRKGVTSQHIIVGLIIVVGLLLRLWGINFGLPYLYDADEPGWVSVAYRILQNRDLNPHWFGHPGTTTIYMLSGLYAFIFLIGRGLGIFAGVGDFRTLYYRDPTVFYLSGRFMTALFGVVTILLVYLIGERLFNRRIGLMAATLIALSPIHVYYSKLIRADVQMSFLLLVAFWFCLSILEKRDWSNYILAGFFTGLAVTTKYPATIFILIIGLAHLASTQWQIRDHFKLLGGGVACLAGAFLGSPFLFLDFRTALSDLRIEARPAHLSATGEGLIQNIVWYLRRPLPNAVSMMGLVCAGVGFLLCLASRQKGRRLLITFPLFFLLFISSLNLRWNRWIVPAIPFLCILLAYAVYELARWVGRRLNPQAALWVGFILFVTISAPLLRADVLQGREMSGVDTRTLAGQWMINNISAGSRVLVEVYTPQLPKRLFDFFQVSGGALVEIDAEKTKPETFRPRGHIGRIRDVQDVQRHNIDYMVMSNIYDRYLAERENYPEIVAAYEKLMSSGTLIYEVQSTPGVNRGPRIRIYRLN